MKIALSNDHAGYTLKSAVHQHLLSLGHEVIDLGCNSSEPSDYPDYAFSAGEAVVQGRAERAVVLCGSGVGACIAANKIKGVRACVCHDTYSAHQGVEHDDMNILCLGSRIIGAQTAAELVSAFTAARYTAEPRHARRLQKIIDREATEGADPR